MNELCWGEYHVVAHSFAGNSITPYLASCQDDVLSYVIMDAYGLITVPDDNFVMLQKKKLDAARAKYRKTEGKYLERKELRRRLEKSTLPKEFQDLWMERGVCWNEKQTAGYFRRDTRYRRTR